MSTALHRSRWTYNQDDCTQGTIITDVSYTKFSKEVFVSLEMTS